MFEQRNNGIWRCNKRRVIRKDEIMEVTPRDDSNTVQKQIKQPVNKKLNFSRFFFFDIFIVYQTVVREISGHSHYFDINAGCYLSSSWEEIVLSKALETGLSLNISFMRVGRGESQAEIIGQRDLNSAKIIRILTGRSIRSVRKGVLNIFKYSDFKILLLDFHSLLCLGSIIKCTSLIFIPPWMIKTWKPSLSYFRQQKASG